MNTVVENTEMTEDIPFAKVKGEPYSNLPKDLYIPPDALEVFLETFEGPLDLLLYLIKRQNLDILDIPIASITKQYMEYVEIMKQLRLELAAEYLVMAAMLAEIKSRMLLPRPKKEDDDDEDDPRAELVRRLQEYECIKKAAENLDEVPRVGRDVFFVNVEPPEYQPPKQQPKVELKEILIAFANVMKRAQLTAHHRIEAEPLSVRERMTQVITQLTADKFTEFMDLFDIREGRMGVVVTLLAILELIRESIIEIVQSEPFAPIHVKVRS